jgi:transposase
MIIEEGRFAGVDVTKGSIEVAVRPTGEFWTATPDDYGLAETAEKLRSLEPELVVMEAAGRFELPVAGALATVGLPFALVHPRNLREFARAIGRINKVDTHAGLLAQFAELVRPEAKPLSTELIQQLKDLRKRRQELIEMVTLEKSRLEVAQAAVHRELQSHVRFLEKSLSSLEDQFNRTIRFSPIWR